MQESRIRNYIYYELNTSVLEEIMVWLSDLQRRSGTEENGTGAVDFPEIQKNGNEASGV
ncbi:MAG: hypothetical protein LUH19_10090 [Lachnospiraceae bacterium]|nr:hypothetical protein [Lachnospiraceae bacterium]